MGKDRKGSSFCDSVLPNFCHSELLFIKNIFVCVFQTIKKKCEIFNNQNVNSSFLKSDFLIIRILMKIMNL